jgi:hypothetical protein
MWYGIKQGQLPDALIRVRKATISFVISVCQSGTYQFKLEGFSWNLVFENFSKLSWKLTLKHRKNYKQVAQWALWKLKLPVKNLGRHRCAEGSNSGVKGLEGSVKSVKYSWIFLWIPLIIYDNLSFKSSYKGIRFRQKLQRKSKHKFYHK